MMMLLMIWSLTDVDQKSNAVLTAAHCVRHFTQTPGDDVDRIMLFGPVYEWSYWFCLLTWFIMMMRNTNKIQDELAVRDNVDCMYWYDMVMMVSNTTRSPDFLQNKLNSTQMSLRFAVGTGTSLGKSSRMRFYNQIHQLCSELSIFLFQERKTCPGVRAPAEESVKGDSSSRLSSERGHLAVSMGHVGRGHVGRGGVSFVKTFREKKL